MNYYELKIKVILNEDINYNDAPYKIGIFINNAMLNNSLLKKVHEEKIYKYVYDTFYPREETGIYQKGKNYEFRLRSLNLHLLNKLAIALYNHNYSGIKASDIDLNVHELNEIKELYTVKPVIITINNKPWLKNNSSIEDLKKRLNDNLDKKLKQFEGNLWTGEDNYSFIKEINILNRVPMKYYYKGIKLLGNKVKIIVNEDEFSQRKALMAIGLGLGEKGSSLGAGFCIYK